MAIGLAVHILKHVHQVDRMNLLAVEQFGKRGNKRKITRNVGSKRRDFTIEFGKTDGGNAVSLVAPCFRRVQGLLNGKIPSRQF